MLDLGTALLVGLTLAAGGAGPEAQLLAGAEHFRAERYADALVAFRVAERLGAPDARPYAGAALVKLGRAEEAIEAFGEEPAGGRDALLDYYRAVACHDARLYLCADRILAGIGDRSGPRIAEQAGRMRARIAAMLANEPETATVDWYLGRCAALGKAGRRVLAAAFCRESAALAARRGDRYRLEEATAAIAPLENAAAAREVP